MEEKEEKKIDDRPLSEKYSEFDVQPIVNESGRKIYEFGSKQLTKILKFRQEEKFGNNEIDYYMGIAPARQEGELKQFDEKGHMINDPWKNRLKFQHVLFKFRKFLYRFPSGRMKDLKAKLKRDRGIAYAD